MAVTAVVCAGLVIGLVSNSAVSALFGLARDGIYTAEVKRLASTDLSGILIDEMKIGADMADLDLTVYTADRPNMTGDYDYFFDQVRIGVDEENRIDAVTAFNESVNVNGAGGIRHVDEITALLGNNYLDRSQDREQQLRKRIYYDSGTGVIAEFVYAKHTCDFAWIVLRKAR